MSKPFSFSLIIVALILGMGLGYTLTPEYQAMKQTIVSMELGPADRFLDSRYLSGLISHHLQAIDMSRQVLNKSHREDLRTLAQDIITADEQSIKQLNRYRLSWYQDAKPVEKFTKINLGDNDGKFDLRFLNALINHHDEAIVIAKDVRTKSTRTEVLNLADTVITDLASSRAKLITWRRDWYAID